MIISPLQQNFVVDDTLDQKRLDQALAICLPDHSRTQIKQWIMNQQVQVNATPAKPKQKVKTGDHITVTITPKPAIPWEAEAIPLDIVYEDEALIVINKPPGLVTHPGAGNMHCTLLNALLHHEPALRLLPRAGILHRLDKNTSGLLLIAKTEQALKSLGLQLKKRTLLRAYQALVYGRVISGGTIDAPIDRHYRERTRMAVSETGKPAVTHYRVLKKYTAYTHLQVRLETGRTHQIRVHLAHINRPIIGDLTYGGRFKLTKNTPPPLITALRQFKRQALHAYQVGFSHPVTKEWMQFESNPPADMQALMALLESHAL